MLFNWFKSSPLHLFITGLIHTRREPHLGKPREWFQIFFQTESEDVKIQHKWTYHDLLECIEFREMNIIPWDDPIMEQFQSSNR